MKTMKMPLKYLVRISIVVLLMTSMSSRQSWHEAKEVIVEADSLLANGVIMRDTAALAI